MPNTKILKEILLTLLLMALAISFAIPLYASNYEISSLDHTSRLYGDDRYKTAQAIAEQMNTTTIDCVVLAPGSSFANALPASVLAHKNNAPLLLLDRTAASTKEAFDYIDSHLSKTGKIYLVGDRRLIGYDFIAKLRDLGYQNVITVSGNNRYETDYLIARKLNIPDTTPVIISSGENFPDAMVVSTFAAANGWPILLTNGYTLTPDIRRYIIEKKPAEIFITGGVGAVSQSLENELKRMVGNTKITRLAGKDRYETAVLIANHFAPDPPIIYIASAHNYIDAIAGSVLAAKTNSPIILVNPSTQRLLTHDVMRFMLETKKRQSNTKIIALGGPAALPEDAFALASGLGGQPNLTSLGQPVEYSYAIEKDSRWRLNRALVEHDGELSDEQELALLTAVWFYNEWLTVDYRTVDESTFGHQYATQRFAQTDREKVSSLKNLFTRQTYVNQVEKLTVTSIGTYTMLQDTPYTYVRIHSDSVAFNAEMGGRVKRSETHIVCMYNIHGYWEVDLVQ